MAYALDEPLCNCGGPSGPRHNFAVRQMDSYLSYRNRKNVTTDVSSSWSWLTTCVASDFVWIGKQLFLAWLMKSGRCISTQILLWSKSVKVVKESDSYQSEKSCWFFSHCVLGPSACLPETSHQCLVELTARAVYGRVSNGDISVPSQHYPSPGFD